MQLVGWNDWDKDTLDRAYAPSRTVERVSTYVRLWTDLTTTAKERLSGTLRANLAYGDHPRQVLDYYGCGKPGAPLLIFIHGGFWQALSKEQAGFAATMCAAEGVNFAAINYRLGQEARLTDIADDIRAALRHLGARSADLGFDPSRVVLSGHSAGGHLTALMLTEPDWGGLTPVGAVPIAGIFDLRPVRACYVNDVMGMDEEEAVRLSPTEYRPAHAVPLMLCYGEHDTEAFKDHSKLLASLWAPHLPAVAVYEQPALNHFNGPLDLMDPEARITASALDMLRG